MRAKLEGGPADGREIDDSFTASYVLEIIGGVAAIYRRVGTGLYCYVPKDDPVHGTVYGKS